jgi:putative PIN family toxin of toxin-antitoxin system
MLCNDGNVQIYFCKELIYEFEDVSSRSKIRKYITEQDITDTLELINRYCIYEIIDIDTKVISVLRDMKDLYLLSLADMVSADYIVTGDKDLLVLQKHNQTRIVTFSEFKAIMKY